MGLACLLPACATLDVLGTWMADEPETGGPGSLSPNSQSQPPRRPWAQLEGDAPEENPAPAQAAEAREEDLTPGAEQDLVSRPGIQMGMNRSEVRKLWGTPADVEVAGDANAGNFRWIYPLSTHRDLADSRIVTFESGRVAGWETVRPD
jgi:hypothetical protein